MIGLIPSDKYLRRGFSLLQMLYWCSVGSSSTYIVSYMTAVRNASATMTGNLLAVYMLAGVAGQFLINSICDRFQNNRKVFQAGMLLGLLVWLGVYFAPNTAMIFVMYGLLGFIQPTMSAVLDTWLIRSFPNDAGAYSPIRSLGSLAYSCLMLVMGFAIDGIGHVVMLLLPALFTAGSIITARFMPESPPLNAQREKAARSAAGMRSLAPVVWMFVMVMVFMGVANMPLLNMNLMIMENAGGSVTHQGIAISFNTVAEFLTMCFFMKWISKASATRKLQLAGLLYLVSVIMIFSFKSIPALYVAYFINGVGYGVLLPARRQFINEMAPENLLNRMHGVGDMAHNSVGGLLGNKFSGTIIDQHGVGVMVLISMILDSISFAVMMTFGPVHRRWKRKQGIDSAD